MIRVIIVSIVCGVLSSLADAKDWQRFHNSRYDFSAEVPSSFRVEDEGDDGWTFVDDRGAVLLVFAQDLFMSTFAGEASNKIVMAQDDGWTISDSTVGQERMRYTGEKAGRILEGYGIWLCYEAAALIRLEYDQASAQAYQPVIERVKAGLKPPEGCELQDGFYDSP